MIESKDSNQKNEESIRILNRLLSGYSKDPHPASQQKAYNILQSLSLWQQDSFFIYKFPVSIRILNLIFGLSFTSLTKLILIQCSIQTIESIIKINVPRLTEFVIDRNYIIRGSSIRKCNWPQLHALHIDKNQIIDIPLLTEGNFLLKQADLGIENYYPQSTLQSQSLNWVAKLRNDEIEVVNSRNQRRILERSVKEKLVEKSVRLNIWDRKQIGFMVSDGESDISD